MTQTIWKYPLPLTDRTLYQMPKGAEILCVQLQNNEPQLWASVNPSSDTETREIITVGTGNNVPADVGRYIGTYQVHGGDFIFHVFEARP